jgi:hypothetical protein
MQQEEVYNEMHNKKKRGALPIITTPHLIRAAFLFLLPFLFVVSSSSADIGDSIAARVSKLDLA